MKVQLDEYEVEALMAPDFWRRLCPWLHVEGVAAAAAPAQSEAEPRAPAGCATAREDWGTSSATSTVPAHAWNVAAMREHLVSEGYMVADTDRAALVAEAMAVPPPPTQQPQQPPTSQHHGLAIPTWGLLMVQLRRGIEALVALGLAPSLVLVYDEAWLLPALLAPMLEPMAPGNRLLGDWYMFHVDGAGTDTGTDAATDTKSPPPGQAGPGAGWPPHRDRPGADPRVSFHTDGSPRFMTVWVALSDATPQSSCLMVVPARDDPAYFVGDLDEERGPLASVFDRPQAWQSIVALPVSAGSVVAFSSRLLHWGSKAQRHGSPSAAGTPPLPRIAVSFALADPTFEQPYFDTAALPSPPLPLRVALVAGQALNYHAQAPLSRRNADLFTRLFMSQKASFHEDYHAKIANAAQWIRFSRSYAS